MRTHIFNVSGILSADNIKNTNVFLLFFFFLLSLNWEREYVIAILRKSVGRNSLKVYLVFRRVPSESIFFFYGLAGFYIAQLECVCHLIQELSASSPGVAATVFTHLVMPAATLKLIFFIPISTDKKGCYFRFRILANHLASFFCQVIHLDYCLFHSVTECKHLLAFILTWICYFAARNWPTFLFLFLMVSLWRPVN